MTQRAANIICALSIIIAAAVFVFLAHGIVEPSAFADAPMSARFFPITVLVCVIICAILVVVEYGLHIRDGSQRLFSEISEPVRAMLTFITMIGAYFVWKEMGFFAMAVIIGPAMAAIMGVRSPWAYAVLLAFGPAVMWIFETALRIRL